MLANFWASGNGTTAVDRWDNHMADLDHHDIDVDIWERAADTGGGGGSTGLVAGWNMASPVELDLGIDIKTEVVDTFAIREVLKMEAPDVVDSSSSNSSMHSPATPVAADDFMYEDAESVIKAELGAAVGDNLFDIDLSDLDLHGFSGAGQQLHEIQLLQQQLLGGQQQQATCLNAPEDDAVKSDLMWSSTLNINRRRNRDVSMTLSECAESLFTDIDLLGSSPTMLSISPAAAFGTTYVDTPVPSESDPEATDEEEIDVVSDDGTMSTCSASSGAHSSSSSASRYQTSAKQQQYMGNKYQHIEAGRSLLRSRQVQPQPTPAAATPTSVPAIVNQTIIDHCYFATSRPPVSPASNGNGGILTPNESSEDEDEMDPRRSSHDHSMLNRKRRLTPSTAELEDSVKFKFRMRFNSNSPQRSLLNINNNQARHHLKRKSALKNTHCPEPSSPVKTIKEENYDDEMEDYSPLREEDYSPLRREVVVTSPSGSESSTVSLRSIGNVISLANSNSNNLRRSRFGGHMTNEQKCKEIRDLHNSMERQRRVDLRNNFDQLKDVVPDLIDVEKASKLTILNKAADYCRMLVAQEEKLRREREKELAKGQLLKRRLLALKNAMSSQPQLQPGVVRMSSDRIAIIGGSRH